MAAWLVATLSLIGRIVTVLRIEAVLREGRQRTVTLPARALPGRGGTRGGGAVSTAVGGASARDGGGGAALVETAPTTGAAAAAEPYKRRVLCAFWALATRMVLARRWVLVFLALELVLIKGAYLLVVGATLAPWQAVLAILAASCVTTVPDVLLAVATARGAGQPPGTAGAGKAAVAAGGVGGGGTAPNVNRTQRGDNRTASTGGSGECQVGDDGGGGGVAGTVSLWSPAANDGRFLQSPSRVGSGSESVRDDGCGEVSPHDVAGGPVWGSSSTIHEGSVCGGNLLASSSSPAAGCKAQDGPTGQSASPVSTQAHEQAVPPPPQQQHRGPETRLRLVPGVGTIGPEATSVRNRPMGHTLACLPEGHQATYPQSLYPSSARTQSKWHQEPPFMNSLPPGGSGAAGGGEVLAAASGEVVLPPVCDVPVTPMCDLLRRIRSPSCPLEFDSEANAVLSSSLAAIAAATSGGLLPGIQGTPANAEVPGVFGGVLGGPPIAVGAGMFGGLLGGPTPAGGSSDVSQRSAEPQSRRGGPAVRDDTAVVRHKALVAYKEEKAAGTADDDELDARRDSYKLRWLPACGMLPAAAVSGGCAAREASSPAAAASDLITPIINDGTDPVVMNGASACGVSEFDVAKAAGGTASTAAGPGDENPGSSAVGGGDGGKAGGGTSKVGVEGSFRRIAGGLGGNVPPLATTGVAWRGVATASAAATHAPPSPAAAAAGPPSTRPSAPRAAITSIRRLPVSSVLLRRPQLPTARAASVATAVAALGAVAGHTMPLGIGGADGSMDARGPVPAAAGALPQQEGRVLLPAYKAVTQAQIMSVKIHNHPGTFADYAPAACQGIQSYLLNPDRAPATGSTILPGPAAAATRYHTVAIDAVAGAAAAPPPPPPLLPLARPLTAVRTIAVPGCVQVLSWIQSVPCPPSSNSAGGGEGGGGGIDGVTFRIDSDIAIGQRDVSAEDVHDSSPRARLGSRETAVNTSAAGSSGDTMRTLVPEGPATAAEPAAEAYVLASSLVAALPGLTTLQASTVEAQVDQESYKYTELRMACRIYADAEADVLPAAPTAGAGGGTVTRESAAAGVAASGRIQPADTGREVSHAGVEILWVNPPFLTVREQATPACGAREPAGTAPAGPTDLEAEPLLEWVLDSEKNGTTEVEICLVVRLPDIGSRAASAAPVMLAGAGTDPRLGDDAEGDEAADEEGHHHAMPLRLLLVAAADGSTSVGCSVVLDEHISLESRAASVIRVTLPPLARPSVVRVVVAAPAAAAEYGDQVYGGQPGPAVTHAGAVPCTGEYDASSVAGAAAGGKGCAVVYATVPLLCVPADVARELCTLIGSAAVATVAACDPVTDADINTTFCTAVTDLWQGFAVPLATDVAFLAEVAAATPAAPAAAAGTIGTSAGGSGAVACLGAPVSPAVSSAAAAATAAALVGRSAFFQLPVGMAVGGDLAVGRTAVLGLVAVHESLKTTLQQLGVSATLSYISVLSRRAVATLLRRSAAPAVVGAAAPGAGAVPGQAPSIDSTIKPAKASFSDVAFGGNDHGSGDKGADCGTPDNGGRIVGGETGSGGGGSGGASSGGGPAHSDDHIPTDVSPRLRRTASSDVVLPRPLRPRMTTRSSTRSLAPRPVGAPASNFGAGGGGGSSGAGGYATSDRSGAANSSNCDEGDEAEGDGGETGSQRLLRPRTPGLRVRRPSVSMSYGSLPYKSQSRTIDGSVTTPGQLAATGEGTGMTAAPARSPDMADMSRSVPSAAAAPVGGNTPSDRSVPSTSRRRAEAALAPDGDTCSIVEDFAAAVLSSRRRLLLAPIVGFGRLDSPKGCAAGDVSGDGDGSGAGYVTGTGGTVGGGTGEDGESSSILSLRQGTRQGGRGVDRPGASDALDGEPCDGANIERRYELYCNRSHQGMDVAAFAILMMMFAVVTWRKLLLPAAISPRSAYNLVMLWVVALTVMMPYVVRLVRREYYVQHREFLMVASQLVNGLVYGCFASRLLPMPPEMKFHWNHSHVLQRGVVRPVRRPVRFATHLRMLLIEVVGVTPAFLASTGWRRTAVTTLVTYSLSAAVGYALDLAMRRVFLLSLVRRRSAAEARKDTHRR